MNMLNVTIKSNYAEYVVYSASLSITALIIMILSVLNFSVTLRIMTFSLIIEYCSTESIKY